MPSYINTNLASLNAQRNLNSSQGALHTSLQRLSSGLRVNSAKDDAAGMAIASRMESQIRGLNQAVRNANDGISLAQTAEGALGAIQSNMQRMRELAIQGANATSNGDIAAIDAEFTQLNAENARIVAATSFNGVALLSAAVSQTFQVGANSTAGVDDLTITTAAALAPTSTTLGTSSTTAQAEISKLDTDIASVASLRSTFGSVQSRFESVINNLQIASENQAASRSRIMDADYAAETAALTRAQILQQAGTAMLAQANQSPNTVLTLLR
ncbi:MAG: flagellin FliC [Gallionellaceae bacterium]|nr:MAG: flagellin FliC [Gallionellaceae bacterium]